MMKRNLMVIILTGFALCCFPAKAEEVRQLTWIDLVPAHLLAEDPLADLTEKQKDLVYWVIYTLESLPLRGPDTEALYEEVDNAMPSLKEAGIDINKLMAKRKQVRTTIVEALNGKQVRIPGYLLPLEVSAAKITEFLLVPYVGACIHVPPPPPNQIIYVKILQKNGYQTKSLYEPVWVTGVIRAKSMEKDLYLVDGSAGVDIGYSMQATIIEPYKEKAPG
jgi:hypothetical protein